MKAFLPLWVNVHLQIVNQRPVLRDRWCGTIASEGEKWSELVPYTAREKIFSTGPTRAAKAEQKSLGLERQAQQANQGRTPYICTLWVPICPVSTIRRGHPSLFSGETTRGRRRIGTGLDPLPHKVLIYIEHHSVCPLVGIGTPPPL
jgi:hypothetical protein